MNKLHLFFVMSDEPLLLDPGDAIFCNHREICEKELTDLGSYRYFGGTSNGKYHGHANYFDADNNLKATVNYEEGKRVGPFTVYKKDNAIFCFGSYNDGGRIEKISYHGDRGLYTWNCEGELHCSLKTISDGIIYRFNVNSEGNADGNGEMEENGQKADVEFENGHIKKSPKCKCYTSYLVTIGLIICGVGICYYLYFKFHVFLFKH